MLEMTVLVAVAGVWSAVRVVRCERCGVPMGLLEVLVRSLTFSERCSACRRLERAREPRFTTRLSSDPELGLRAAEIRYALAEMVRRQREELHEAQRALTDESVGSSPFRIRGRQASRIDVA